MEAKFRSPSGTYLIEIHPQEARMSHTIQTPRLLERESGRSLFDFSTSLWSLDNARWLDEVQVQLSLRRYPGDHSPSVFEVLIDCERKFASLDGQSIALSELEKYLEAWYLRAKASYKAEHVAPRAASLSRYVSALARVFKR